MIINPVKYGAIALAVTALGWGLPAGAGEGHGPTVTVEDVWMRPSIPNRPSAAYMVIRNAGDAADALRSASSPRFESIELHLSSKTDGVMKMERVNDIPVAAGGDAVLAPGGFHLMLFGAREPLRVGDVVPLTLTFEQAGEMVVDAEVMRKQPTSAGHDGHGGHGGHGNHGASGT